MTEAKLAKTKNRPQSRELEENHLYLKPHHVEVSSIEGFGTLYYLSKRNLRPKEIRRLLCSYFPPGDTHGYSFTQDEDYINMVGSNPPDYETFIERNAQVVETIPFYPNGLPVTIKATEEDVLCRTCIDNEHCRRFYKNRSELNRENRKIPFLLTVLRYRRNAARQKVKDNALFIMIDDSKPIHELHTQWHVLKDYYEEVEGEYYMIYPDRR